MKTNDNLVARHRASLGMNLKTYAGCMGLHPQYVRDVERGKYPVSDRVKLRILRQTDNEKLTSEILEP